MQNTLDRQAIQQFRCRSVGFLRIGAVLSGQHLLLGRLHLGFVGPILKPGFSVGAHSFLTGFVLRHISRFCYMMIRLQAASSCSLADFSVVRVSSRKTGTKYNQKRNHCQAEE